MSNLIASLIKKFKYIFFIVIVLTAIASSINLWIITTIEAWVRNNEHDTAYPFYLFFLAISILFISQFYSQFQLNITGEKITKKIRSKLIQLVLEQNFSRLSALGKPRLLTSLTEDIHSISSALSLLPLFLVNLGVILFSAFYLYSLSPSLLLSFALIASTGYFFSISIIRLAIKTTIDKREKQDDLYTIFKASIDGFRDLDLNQNRRQFFLSKLVKPCLDNVEEVAKKNHLYWSLYDSWCNILLILSLFILTYLGSNHFELKSDIL
ncbi:MAG: ABC transporter transmembrane domain-containing protein, partial [Pseudomonadota bacterium]